MAENENENDKGFVVRDRRRFAGDGSPQDPPAAASEEEGPPPPGASRAAADAVRGGPKGPEPAEPLGGHADAPAIDFTTFVFSLGSSALIHLGDAPDPDSGAVGKNLALAKETIDLLSMLQGKTRGNLSAEEDRFLASLLYDLRLRFIEAAR